MLRSPLRSLRFENGVFKTAIFDGGREESADALVLALPHDRIAELLPPEIRAANPSLMHLEKFKVSPITGVHFWFDRHVTNEPFLTMLDTQTQWVFNKTALFRKVPPATTSEKGQYLQLVISASYHLLKKSREEIINLCLKEIRQALPAARDAQLVRAIVIKEVAATFSPEPGVDHWRAAQETETPGLFLAGDWTDTGWPATMEGAVRSGYLAAEAVLRRTHSPQKILRPDLPASGLSRLFG
jgi:uncharacterized protein with NAD-binding domain and iron-sulfur cluster